MHGLDFVYFYIPYCYIFLMFVWTGILGLYFVWQNDGKSNLLTSLHESKLFV